MSISNLVEGGLPSALGVIFIVYLIEAGNRLNQAGLTLSNFLKA
jgi:hypothetical protein